MTETTGNGSETTDQTQWNEDRALESTPLPGSEMRHYGNDYGTMRQIDLNAAEDRNKARAAGELDMTVQQWEELRRNLGRSPVRSDVKLIERKLGQDGRN